MTPETGQIITLLCKTPDGALPVYEWSKEEQVLSNKSECSSKDIGSYTYHAISSSGVTTYKTSLCQSAVGTVAAAVTGMLM